MIKRLDNTDKYIAQKIHSVFLASYEVEAKWLAVSDFPPLKRRLESYINSDTYFYALFKNEEIAAIIEISTNPNETELHSLVVLPKFFRQGLGSQLLDFIITNFDSKSYIVETGLKNEAAIKLYQSFGFREESQWDLNDDIRKVKFRRNKISKS